MISVIVPVFNLAPYVPECLNSLIAQTYKDIEIIVVDDCSTDWSGQLCDSYALRDSRIVVFHTENHGLSAARNYAIDRARGEWLMFVDADDYVEQRFCELPLKTAEEYGADMVIFGRRFFGGAESKEIVDENALPMIVSRETAVEKGRPAVWNKLYKASLFGGIRYPEGRIFEDVATTHKLVYRAERIVMITAVLYNYRMRHDSLSHTNDAVRDRDLFRAHLQRYEDLVALGHPKEKAEKVLVIQSLRYLMRLPREDDVLYSRAAAVVSDYRGSLDGLSTHERNALRMWRLDKAQFHCCCRQLAEEKSAH